MMGTCFVVAFGHGTASEHIESPGDMAEVLRNLVDTACKAKGRRFNTKVSVSVAPGGVMFALADDEPDRAMELCQAVVAQLEHQATTHLTLPPVCAAITHGPMRHVDVLGFSSNFEGWPAIAAARVVAKLAPGECAFEQSVWDFSSVLRDCGAARDVPGKAHDKPFQVRIHHHIQFPTRPRSQMSHTPILADPSPLPLSPDEEFTHTLPQPTGSLASPGNQNVHYEGKIKIEVCKRLQSDWQTLADYLEIPPADRPGFEHGREPQSVWEWLERRGRLAELAPALAGIERADLAKALQGTQPEPSSQLPSLTPYTAASDTPIPIQLRPYAESAQKARERITTLLQDPRAHALRAAIMQQGQGQSAEDILVPTHATSLLHTLKRLHDATHTCLQVLTTTQPQYIGPTKAVAMNIFSCLTGLAINHEELMNSGQAFNPWQHRLQRSLPLASEASVEVMVSSLGEHQARFRTLKDNTHPRWVGKDSITNDELETGLTHSDRLTGLQQRIWCAVMQVERAPEPFGNHELQRLQSILGSRDEDKTHLYYITLSQTQDSSSPIDAALLESLLQTLPALRVFSFKNQHGTSLLCVDEYRLWARIDEFLNMVEAS